MASYYERACQQAHEMQKAGVERMEIKIHTYTCVYIQIHTYPYIYIYATVVGVAHCHMLLTL